MKALTQRLAAACETAITPPPKCKCRCNGAVHGAARHIFGDVLFYLVSLPPTDPHWVKNKNIQLRLPEIA